MNKLCPLKFQVLYAAYTNRSNVAVFGVSTALRWVNDTRALASLPPTSETAVADALSLLSQRRNANGTAQFAPSSAGTYYVTASGRDLASALFTGVGALNPYDKTFGDDTPVLVTKQLMARRGLSYLQAIAQGPYNQKWIIKHTAKINPAAATNCSRLQPLQVKLIELLAELGQGSNMPVDKSYVVLMLEQRGIAKSHASAVESVRVAVKNDRTVEVMPHVSGTIFLQVSQDPRAQAVVQAYMQTNAISALAAPAVVVPAAPVMPVVPVAAAPATPPKSHQQAMAVNFNHGNGAPAVPVQNPPAKLTYPRFQVLAALGNLHDGRVTAPSLATVQNELDRMGLHMRAGLAEGHVLALINLGLATYDNVSRRHMGLTQQGYDVYCNLFTAGPGGGEPLRAKDLDRGAGRVIVAYLLNGGCETVEAIALASGLSEASVRDQLKAMGRTDVPLRAAAQANPDAYVPVEDEPTTHQILQAEVALDAARLEARFEEWMANDPALMAELNRQAAAKGVTPAAYHSELVKQATVTEYWRRAKAIDAALQALSDAQDPQD